MSPKAWYENVSDLADLWRWLDEGNTDLAIDPQHYLDEPWSYQPEWDQMLKAEEDGIKDVA